METTLMSSWDGVSGVIGVNVFTGFARAVGFLCMASGGDGWLNKDVMLVGPQLLVCLPMGATVWCTAGASWLTGLTGVGHLTSVACWSNSSVEGLWSDVSMLGCALSMLISCWVLWYCGVCLLSWVLYSGVSVDSYVSVVLCWKLKTGKFLLWVCQSVEQSSVASTMINTGWQSVSQRCWYFDSSANMPCLLKAVWVISGGFWYLASWFVWGTICTLHQTLYAWLMRGLVLVWFGILNYRVLCLSLRCDSWYACYAINLVK